MGSHTQHPAGSSVHSGYPQCPGGLSLLAPPTTQFRVVPEHGGLSIFTASTACDDRPLCHLRQLEMFTISCFSAILCRRVRTPFSSPGTVSKFTLFRRGPFFPRASKDATLTSSLLTGLSVRGSRTSSRCRWLLRWSFPTAQTFSSSLSLVSATQVSTGWRFMPGNYQAVHQSGGFLLCCSVAGCFGAQAFIPHELSA